MISLGILLIFIQFNLNFLDAGWFYYRFPNEKAHAGRSPSLDMG